jgi:hypothetical protein
MTAAWTWPTSGKLRRSGDGFPAPVAAITRVRELADGLSAMDRAPKGVSAAKLVVTLP